MSKELKRGTVVLFASGEYSDYGYCGEVVTTKDFDLLEQIEAYKAFAKTEPDWDPEYESYDQGAFVTWLTAQGYCVPLECETIHIGSYGQLEVSR